PVKLLREVLGTANDLAGRPFCSQAELEERRATVERGGATRREPAPVMLYFDGKDHRTKKKMEELLTAKEIPFKLLDVTDDEATRSWATTAAKQIEFPLLFIAGEPVGKDDVSSFRKIAIGTWRTAYDPSVYGTIELRMDEAMRYIAEFREKYKK